MGLPFWAGHPAPTDAESRATLQAHHYALFVDYRNISCRTERELGNAPSKRRTCAGYGFELQVMDAPWPWHHVA